MRRPAYRVLHIAPPGVQGVTYVCNTYVCNIFKIYSPLFESTRSSFPLFESSRSNYM